MLTKVFKSESKLLWKVVLPVCIIALSLGLFSGILGVVLYFLAESGMDFWLIGLSSLDVIVHIGYIGAVVVGLVYVPVRFYKSVFTDEGYLTMVLPVSTHRLLLGKMLSGLLFAVVLGAALLVSTCLSEIPSTVLYYLHNDFGAELPSFGDISSGGTVLETLLSFFYDLCVAIENFVLVYTAIIIGCTVIKRGKIFGAFLFLFVVTAAWSILSSLVSLLVWVTIDNYLINSLCTALFALVVTFFSYLLSHRLLHRHFNIE